MGDVAADSTNVSNPLLRRGDPSPFVVANSGGASPFLLVGDHAGRAIPRRLRRLGLPPEVMDLHIAWDIGVAGLGARLAEALDAAFIRQTYSRLVIDCNRRPGADDGAPAVSDGVPIPGNRQLTEADLAARRAAIYDPYHGRIADLLDARVALGRPTLLVSLHSFTPVFQGQARPWRFGVLHRGDSALSRTTLALLRRALGDEAGDNQPYAMDGIDNTVPLHADPRGLDYLELEVRQDLIANARGQAEVAALLAPLLTEALAQVLASGPFSLP